MEIKSFDEIVVRFPLNANKVNLDQLFFANSDLVKLDYIHDDKAKQTRLKYLIRNKYKCTPFGLFSGVQMGTFSSSTEYDKLNYRRITQLDSTCIYSILEKLNSDYSIRQVVKYYPNDTIYNLGSNFHFYEVVNSRYVLSSVECSHMIEHVLNISKGGAVIEELINSINDNDLSKYDKTCFINELIDAGLLVSEIRVSVVGSDMCNSILNILNNIKARYTVNIDILELYISCLKQIILLLKIADSNGIADDNLNIYHKIRDLLGTLNLHYYPKNFLQSHIVFNSYKHTLNENIRLDVIDAVKSLSRLTEFAPNLFFESKRLNEFKTKFIERWGEREMPLLDVIDGQMGIGYPSNTIEPLSPLLDGLKLFKQVPDTFPIYNSTHYSFWLNKLIDAYKFGNDSINIDNNEIEAFPSQIDKLPNVFSVMFSVLKESDSGDSNKSKILIKSVGGHTAGYLIGRFSLFDEKIELLLKKLCDKEAEYEPGKLIAELVYLPFPKAANVLQRSDLREFKISICQTVNNDISNIKLDDLFISIRENKIHLRSKIYNKEVIVKHTTSHNYRHYGIPVYRFLCDLQLQDKLPGLNINIEYLNNVLRYTPRITVNNNIVLELATWRFGFKDYSYIISSENSVQALYNFILHWKLPRYFCVNDGEDEFVFDTQDTNFSRLFINEIKNRKHIKITEFLFESKGSLFPSPANEIIMFCYKPYEFSSQHKLLQPIHEIRRSFIPGSVWIYFKLFTSKSAADNILMNINSLLIDFLNQKSLIKGFFFVRFDDPEFHIRFRILSTNDNVTPFIIKSSFEVFEQFYSKKSVWNVQIDSYNRELERYGSAIEISEDLFCCDSELIISLLDYLYSYESRHEREENRWQFGFIISIIYINELFSDEQSKLEFVKSRVSDFSKEFNLSKLDRKHVDKIYRQNKQKFNLAQHNRIDTCNNLLEKFKIKLSNISDILDKSVSADVKVELWKSYIHMSVNRLFSTKNRLHEYIIYFMVEKHYRAIIGKTTHE